MVYRYMTIIIVRIMVFFGWVFRNYYQLLPILDALLSGERPKSDCVISSSHRKTSGISRISHSKVSSFDPKNKFL